MFNYNIADIFTIHTNVDSLDIPSFYAVDEIGGIPDLTLMMGFYGNVKPEGNYYNIEDTLLLQDLNHKTKVCMNSARYKVFKQLSINEFYLIKALIQIKLLQKRHSLLHAACLAKKNQGIVLSAASNTGKTFTALELAKYHNFDFLSDDMTIVSENGFASSYPIPLSINENHVKRFKISLTHYEKLQIYLKKNIFFKIPWLRLLFEPFDYDVLRLKLKIPVNPVPIKTLFLLERGENSVSDVSKEDAFYKLWMNNRLNIMFYEIRELVAYSYGNSVFNLDELLSTSKVILSSMLNKVDEVILICRNDKRFEIPILENY